MLCFFAMGFVDLVGIASNYVKADLGLSDAEANIFPSLVFFWFLIFSVPTGVLMNRIGRKNTVVLSLAVTFVSLLLPIFGDSYGIMLCSFSLLGIGNALMQTSLNPLLSNIITGDKLASSLTFGQFVKAIASFLAPYIAMWGATQAIPEFGMGWRVLFPVYMAVAVIAVLWLSATPIEEEAPDKASGFVSCLRLLGRPFILLCFLGIMCHVEDSDGTLGNAARRCRLCHQPLLHLPYLGMLVGGSYLAEGGFETFLGYQRGVYVGGYGAAVRFDRPDGDLHRHCPYRLRQFERVLHCLLASPPGCARQEERDFGLDDYGSVRRHGLPAADGIRQRCRGAERSRSRDDGGSDIPYIIYV